MVHGAVEVDNVHAFAVPRDGKEVHLMAETAFLAVERRRDIVGFRAAAAPHRIQKQRGDRRLGRSAVFSPVILGDPALNVVRIGILLSSA